MANKVHSEALTAVTKSFDTFAANLFKVIAVDQSENFVLSPLSVSIVLSMAAYGARRETEDQLRSTLALKRLGARTKIGLQSLSAYFNDFEGLWLASRIFYDEMIQPKPEFIKITESVFGSKCKALDFTKSDEASRIVNKWCQDKTNNRINDIVSPDDFKNPDPRERSRFFLMNAVYFKAKWEKPFYSILTTLRPFHESNSSVKNVLTMSGTREYGNGELPEVDAKFVELPFEHNPRHDQVSMFIILPNKIDGLIKLEKKLSGGIVSKLFNGNRCDVDIYLPKFKIESDLELRKPLEKLGLADMFTAKANFTGIAEVHPPLRVGDVMQKAMIEVNESGCEAAAFTRMVLRGGGGDPGPPPPPPIEFRVDHPFLFLIMTRSPPVIIFQGHVTSIDVEHKSLSK